MVRSLQIPFVRSQSPLPQESQQRCNRRRFSELRSSPGVAGVHDVGHKNVETVPLCEQILYQ
jgi:hypothetical protein